MATNANAIPRNRKYGTVETAMIEQWDELSARISKRMNEVHIDREPDDEAAWASNSSMKEMAVATLERERRTIAEIEATLARIKKGEYGLCGSCGEPLPGARLKALPWARLCVQCAPNAVPTRIA